MRSKQSIDEHFDTPNAPRFNLGSSQATCSGAQPLYPFALALAPASKGGRVEKIRKDAVQLGL